MGLINEIEVMATCTNVDGEKFTGYFYIKTFNKGMWKDKMAVQIKNSLNQSGIKKKIVEVRVH